MSSTYWIRGRLSVLQLPQGTSTLSTISYSDPTQVKDLELRPAFRKLYVVRYLLSLKETVIFYPNDDSDDRKHVLVRRHLQYDLRDNTDRTPLNYVTAWERSEPIELLRQRTAR